MTTDTTASVVKQIEVRATPERAFEVFTSGMSRWWSPTHSIGSSPLSKVVVEPEEGGRWYEVGTDGGECSWGRVLVWEPPTRLVLAWQITADWRFDPDLHTEVEVRFTATGDGATRVDLEHRGLDAYGEGAAQIREVFESPGGWPLLLDRFVETMGEPAPGR